MAKKPKKETLDPDRPLFDRQPGEPDKAWQAFVFYRNMELKRSLAGAARLYQKEQGGVGGKSLENRFGEWSGKWHWRKRVEEWDRVLDKRLREQRIYAMKNMQERHLKISQSLQALGGMGLQALQKRLKKAEDDGEETVSTKDLIALLETGMKAERLNLGEPDSIAENRHVIDVEKERRTLQELLKNPELVDAIGKALISSDDSD